MPPIRRSAAVWGAAIAAATAAVYLLRLNAVVGLMVDDAWYVVLAKALSDGCGFRLISSAATPIQPLYPPGFPAVLSLIFHIDAEFPRNVWLLKSVSIAAMMGTGFLTYIYLHRSRQLSREIAVCAALAVTLTPAFVFLATSTVMSECLFALFQLAGLLALHQSRDAPTARAGRNLAILAAVLAAAAMLIRSAAVAVIVAGLIWLLKERVWRRAAWFGAVAILCVFPWLLYARMHAPTAEQRVAHGGAVAHEYVDQLSMRWAGAPVLGRIEPHELLDRIGVNFVDVFGRGIGGILVPTMYRDASESGEEVVSLVPKTGFARPGMGALKATMMISAILSALVFAGFVNAVRERLTAAEVFMPMALGIIMVWPFWSFRFVVPLTPLLVFYFIRGIQALAPRAAGIVLLSLIGLHLYDHMGYIIHARSGGRVGWVAQADDVDSLLEWIHRGGLADDGLLVTTNPGLVYMRTGRKSIASDHPLVEWHRWKQLGVRYVAVLYPLDLPAGQHKVLFQTPGHLWVVEL
jgi:Dolichyl-phosphate-mannose-protein mannosyltransferase